jgi:fucose permease
MSAPIRAPITAGQDSRLGRNNAALIRAMTFTIFLMFAMSTDAVGVIIPQIIRDFRLSMTAAGSFQYASQGGVALGGLGLGFLADRLGRKGAILLGLSVFAAVAFLFGASRSFAVFTALMFVSGLSIGVFKTGALALIGDISPSTRAHTSTMNLVEGFFGVGAVLGPALVTLLLAQGASWKWLYVASGGFCVLLIAAALSLSCPKPSRPAAASVDMKRTLAIAANPWALGFGGVIMLYVGVEAAVAVWMPTLLSGYRGPATPIAAYALPIFYGLRAAGRFLGGWVLGRWRWTLVLAGCGLGILVCFGLALLGGRAVAVFALPGSGLFMSVLYPTLNSKGISCFPRHEHGAISGVLLFFTCLSGVATPLAMGLIGDRVGDVGAGFGLATALAALLLAALVVNWILDPSRALLSLREAAEYAAPPDHSLKAQTV